MPLVLPTTRRFTNSRFGLETNTQSFVSPFTRAVQRVALGGDRWAWTFSLPPMNREQAAVWKQLIDRLEGAAGTFYGFDPDNLIPRGAAKGNPQVSGANQSGSALDIDGCLANTVFLKASDYFEVNGEFKRMTADAIVNGSGQTTLQFKPPLRNSPTDNAIIIVDNPRCVMALTDDQQAMWECDVRGIYQPKTFTAIEVFS